MEWINVIVNNGVAVGVTAYCLVTLNKTIKEMTEYVIATKSMIETLVNEKGKEE